MDLRQRRLDDLVSPLRSPEPAPALFSPRQQDYTRLPTVLDHTHQHRFPPPTPFPGMTTRPLHVPKLRHSPSLPLSPSPAPAEPVVLRVENGRTIMLPARISSQSALRRTQTAAGSTRSVGHRRESVLLAFEEPAVSPVEKTPRGMAWLQKTASRREGKGGGSRTTPERAESKKERQRSATEPVKKMRAEEEVTPKRAMTTGGVGARVMSRLGSMGVGSAERIEEEVEEKASKAKIKTKGWTKRMFSMSRPERKLPASSPSQSLEGILSPQSRSTSSSSEASSQSNMTVVHEEMEGTGYDQQLETISSKVTVATAGTADSGTVRRPPLASEIEQWQVDGGGSQAVQENMRSPPETPRQRASIDMVQEHFVEYLKPERYIPNWRPPIADLELRALADTVKIPVTIEDGSHDVWVAVTLKGMVGGEPDVYATPGTGLGLDVAVLMDTSSYTSPAAFEDMRRQARQLVEGMDTSRDRIAVMTFSCPSLEKRRSSTRPRSGIKILNSSGSVSKKQLIADISSIEPGVQADPTPRDVNLAIREARKTLHAMPLDSSKYGARRVGHVFLITGYLLEGELCEDFDDIQVHVLGVGGLFKPDSGMGGNGYCTSVVAPLGFGSSAAESIFSSGFEVQVKKPANIDQGTNMKDLLALLRMGVDPGSMLNGSVFLTPGEGCRISSIIGPLTFEELRPGDKRTVMVKVEVGNLENHENNQPDSDKGRESPNPQMDFDELERHLEATLGELKTCILTAEVVYQHSSLSAATLRSCVDVRINRFLENSVWGTSCSRHPGLPAGIDLDEHNQRLEVHETLLQAYASLPHCTPRELRDLANTLHIGSQLLRELQHREHLAERYPLHTSHPASILFPPAISLADLHTPSPLGMVRTPGPRPPSASPSPRPLNFAQAAATIRRTNRSPDEARKLWMRLGGFSEEEDEIGYRRRVSGRVAGRVRGNMGGEETEDEEDGEERRVSGGGETIVTMRNVKETDFSPWII